MPRAGHIRARPLRKVLQPGPSAPSPDALHLCKLWRLISVATARRSLLLTVLPSACPPRCLVRERRPVTRWPLGVAAAMRAVNNSRPVQRLVIEASRRLRAPALMARPSRASGHRRILIFRQLLICVNEGLRPASFGMRRASVPALGLPAQARGSGPFVTADRCHAERGTWAALGAEAALAAWRFCGDGGWLDGSTGRRGDGNAGGY
jgi:hypothetical protein